MATMTGYDSGSRLFFRRWAAVAAVAVLCSYVGLLQHVVSHDGQLGDAPCVLCAVGGQPGVTGHVCPVVGYPAVSETAPCVVPEIVAGAVILTSPARGPPILA